MNNLIVIVLLLLCYTSNAIPYYVATNGNDSNNGTSLTEPFKTISKATGIVTAGDIIYVRAGTYEYLSTIYLTKNGTEYSPISLMGYEDERPLVDFSESSFGKRGFNLQGNYWYIKGIDICKAGDNGMFISGGFNTIEYCSFFDNKDTGLQLGNGAHDNNIINCDSYWNADPTDYGDADGFACKLDVGTNNYFYGCRAWLNVDDGWDGYMRGNDDVTTVLENCWTWMNGYFKDGTDAGASANGNGFKMGGSDDKKLKHNFTLINCVAFHNKSKGFDQNNNEGSMILVNCSGYQNEAKNYSISRALADGKICSVTNCLNVDGNISLGSFVIQATNSWMIPFDVTNDDFISLDTFGVSSARNSDGSLPYVNFLHLNKSSDLIDAGILVGYDYLGLAPDIGAFEHDPETSVNSLLNEDLDVYFNGDYLVFPTSKVFHGPATIRLFNLNGQLVLNSIINSESIIKCHLLKQGVYIVVINSGKKNFTKKLVK